MRGSAPLRTGPRYPYATIVVASPGGVRSRGTRAENPGPKPQLCIREPWARVRSSRARLSRGADVAQLAEQRFRKPPVGSSNLPVGFRNLSQLSGAYPDI